MVKRNDSMPAMTPICLLCRFGAIFFMATVCHRAARVRHNVAGLCHTMAGFCHRPLAEDGGSGRRWGSGKLIQWPGELQISLRGPREHGGTELGRREPPVRDPSPCPPCPPWLNRRALRGPRSARRHGARPPRTSGSRSLSVPSVVKSTCAARTTEITEARSSAAANLRFEILLRALRVLRGKPDVRCADHGDHGGTELGRREPPVRNPSPCPPCPPWLNRRALRGPRRARSYGAQPPRTSGFKIPPCLRVLRGKNCI